MLTFFVLQLLVVPALEAFEELSKFPVNKLELLKLVGEGKVDGYR